MFQFVCVHRSFNEIETGFESVLKNHLCVEKNRPICAGSCTSASRKKVYKRKFFYMFVVCITCVLEAAKCFNKIHVCVCFFGSWIWHTISVHEHTLKRPTIHKWNKNFFPSFFAPFSILHFIKRYLPCLRSTAIIVGMKI